MMSEDHALEEGEHEMMGAQSFDSEGTPQQKVFGTVLEAAFVDPAYQWPPPDGQGRNAIELKASNSLIEDFDQDGYKLGEKPATKTTKRKETYKETVTTTQVQSHRGFWCCKWGVEDQVMEDVHRELNDNSNDVDDDDDDIVAKERVPVAPSDDNDAYEVEEPTDDQLERKEQRARRESRKQSRYSRVPEGILIYRLNTSSHKLELVSKPHPRTNLKKLVREMYIIDASPSNEKSRRGMDLVGEDGTKVTLVACEQRTATSWLETMEMMLGKNVPKSGGDEESKEGPIQNSKSLANNSQRGVEDSYLNLAKYSNRLIRSGKVDGTKKKPNSSAASAGIYTSIELQEEDDPEAQEALESIAKRRAVIKDSWDFYRMICSLMRDKHKYDEVFRRMQLDPVYPYLNSMTGLNDPGDDQTAENRENVDKVVLQKDLPQYIRMTKLQMAQDLCKKAEETMPSLVEICKALAGSLGIEEVGVGPIKDARTAIKKADTKYAGDLLKVTDYCRSLLVVKDFPSLLALLELARDSFGPLIRRVKMSSLKSDHKSKPGGYRDCIINLELKDHICEIQVHLWPMWNVCGVDGFRHYRHCVEYNTDSFENPYDALDGLDRKTRAELVVMAEEAVAGTPLENLDWYHEKHILDYFAEVGLFLKHNLDVWAETTLKQLIRLRTESPDIGPDHHETIVLYKYLSQALRKQGKKREADEAYAKVKKQEMDRKAETEKAEKSLWDSMLVAPTEAFEMIMDPNKKEREEEENLKREVKASKKQWRKIRQERFKFLDSNVDHVGGDEKKMDDSVR